MTRISQTRWGFVPVRPDEAILLLLLLFFFFFFYFFFYFTLVLA